MPVVETTDKARADELTRRLDDMRGIESTQSRGYADESSFDSRAKEPEAGLTRSLEITSNESSQANVREATDRSESDGSEALEMRDRAGVEEPGQLGRELNAEGPVHSDGIEGKPTAPSAHSSEGSERSVAEREREIGFEAAEQRKQLYASLESHEREVVERSIELIEVAQNENLPAVLRYLEAHDAYSRAIDAISDQGSIAAASRELARARENLAAKHRLELEAKRDTLRELGLRDSTHQAVDRILELNASARDHALMAQLDIAETRLIEMASTKVLEYRDPHRLERARFISDRLDRVRELEHALAQGNVPELSEFIDEFKQVDNTIRYEREMESRAVEALGLSSEHSQAVLRSLDDSRMLDLGNARETLDKFVAKRAVARVLESRHMDSPVRQKFLERVHDQVREIENLLGQNREPDSTKVRELGAELQRAVEFERVIEARTLEPFDLNPEQVRLVGKTLEFGRVRNYGPALDLVHGELVRIDHNHAVGLAKSLQLTPERARTIDPKIYQVVRENEPIARDLKRGIYLYEAAGRDPIEVAYDSNTRRYAEVAKAIDRGVSPKQAEIRLILEVGQVIDIAASLEMARENPEILREMVRSRRLVREGPERGRGLSRERD